LKNIKEVQSFVLQKEEAIRKEFEAAESAKQKDAEAKKMQNI
jgi:hypothetical protein